VPNKIQEGLNIYKDLSKGDFSSYLKFNGDLIKNNAVAAANVFLPGSGEFVESLFGMFGNKGGLYKDWSKDNDGGLAEVVRWVKNDGENPKQEALDALRLMKERGFENYLGKPTRYGDLGLTWDDITAKFQRAGLANPAGSNQQSTNGNGANNGGASNDVTNTDGTGKNNLLTYAVVGLVAAKLLKLI
jgi:hypothetical protein